MMDRTSAVEDMPGRMSWAPFPGAADVRPQRSATMATKLTEPLTAREQEVLDLLMEASSNQEIADRLYISLRTVETHLGHVYGKLGVRGRVQAMLWAFHEGMVGA